MSVPPILAAWGLAHPAGLWLGLLGLVVIAVHVLKPRRLAVTVPSVFLWRAIERPVSSATPWQRLRWSALLAAQLLAVALLALAVARPTHLRPSPLAAHTVFVVDASGSMAATDGTPDRLAAARARATELRKALPEGGVASIVVAGERARVALTASPDPAVFAAALRTIQTEDEHPDFRDAFALAQSLDTGTSSIGYVLLSDGGLSDEEQKALPGGTRYERVGSQSTNRAVEHLTVESRGSGVHARVNVHNYGSTAVTQVLRFEVDGRTQATATVHVGPAASASAEADLPAGERIAARLDSTDLLAADDVAVAVATRRPDRTVLLVGDTAFWQQLLTSIPGLEVHVAAAGTVPDGTGYDVVVYNQVTVPATPKAPFLAIAAPGGAPGVAVAGTAARPAVTFVKDDPLLSGIDLSGVAIAEAQRVTASGSAEVLVAGERAPLLLRGLAGGQRFDYLAFRITDSNLPVRVAFPLLGDRLITELGGVSPSTESIEVGAPLPVGATAGATVGGPNGERLTLAAGDPQPRATSPGFWTIEVDGAATRLVAVNPPTSESAIAPRSALNPTDPGTRAIVSKASVATSLLPWVLVPLLVVLAVESWLAWRRLGVSRRQWRVAAALRLAVAALLIGALVAPVVRTSSDRQATVFLLDRSASLGTDGQAGGVAWLTQALAKRPADSLTAVVAFGAEARLDHVVQRSSAFDGTTVVVDPTATDLSAALRLGAAVLPVDARKRMVLISDGRSTAGDVAEEASAAKQSGIPVDTHLLADAQGPDAAVGKVSVPRLARTGESVQVRATVVATAAGAANVVLLRDGAEVARQLVSLRAGENSVTFSDTVASGAGAVLRYQVRVDRPGDNQPRNDTAFAAVPVDGPARVLVVEGTSGGAATLVRALTAGGVASKVVSATELPDVRELLTYTGVILVDVPASALSSTQIAALTTTVRDLGRGLVTVGGPSSYGVGGYRESPLGDLLPVDSEILDPKRRRTVAEVLSIDTSGSMAACHCAEGSTQMGANAVSGGINKTDISRAAAERAIQSLAPTDEIGVVAWNTSSSWVIPLQQMPAASTISDGLRKLSPAGNTSIVTSLSAAGASLRASKSELKHIIVFTDGFTSQELIDQAATMAAELYAKDRISVSVLGTGEGASAELAKIAESGHGRYYPGKNLADVPQIMAQEAVIASRDFINEGTFLPEVTSTDPVVAPLTSSPPLLGYVATTAKSAATTLLRIGPDRDPLLATWQAGLGRVTSWTSDASQAWSKQWATWDGYVSFWSRVVKSTFPAGNATGAAQATIAGGQLHVTVQGASAFPDGATATATVSGPDGQRIVLPLVRVAGDTFAADTTVSRAGTYAVGARVDAGGATVLSSSTLASDSYPAEFAPGTSDAALLARIASLSGGRADIAPAQAYDADGLQAGTQPWNLAGPFLLAAALLWPLAVILSRLSVRGATASGARASTGRVLRSARAQLARLGAADPDNLPDQRRARIRTTSPTPPSTHHADLSAAPGSPTQPDASTPPREPSRSTVRAPERPAPPVPARTPSGTPQTVSELVRQKRARRGDGGPPQG